MQDGRIMSRLHENILYIMMGEPANAYNVKVLQLQHDFTVLLLCTCRRL